MRVRILACCLMTVLVTVIAVYAQQFTDQQEHPSCSYCGMDRVRFAHSRMLVNYEGGDSVGTCSIHCMALEYATAIDRVPRQLLVADYLSHELTDAEKAVWVIGGDLPGVMTSRPKWAFADKGEAESFIAEHGGVATDFEEAMTLSYEDMYRDTKRIRNMRSMKMKRMQQKQD